MKNKKYPKPYFFPEIAGILVILHFFNTAFIIGLYFLLRAFGIEFYPELILPCLNFAIMVIETIGLFFFYRKRTQNLTDALERIAHGDFSQEIDASHGPKNDYIGILSRQLNDTMKELQSVQVLKNDFVRNFSHEFKTPIASIYGFSKLLVDHPELPEEEKQKYYMIICEESKRLTSLAQNTLLLSKLNSDAFMPAKEDYLVDEQIEECALQFCQEAEKKNLSVEVNLSHQKITAVKELLSEVWINLLSNAIKYTPENGEINISSIIQDNVYYVSFKDNGQGISEESLSHIFEEYYQEDGSRVNQGIGLGLAIVKKICDLHQFTLTVESKKEKGSTFTVGIPLSF